MALPDYCEDSAVCCDSFFALAENLRATAYAAVNACVISDGCNSLDSFVSVGQPVYAPGDYLATWVDPVAPAYRPPSERQMNLMLPRTLGTVRVRLVESGWPTIDGDGTVPSPAAIHHASRHSYSHGEQMTRAVYRFAQSDRCNTFEIQAARGFIEDIYAVWEMAVLINLDL